MRCPGLGTGIVDYELALAYEIPAAFQLLRARGFRYLVRGTDFVIMEYTRDAVFRDLTHACPVATP